jgi:hypothetical protein
VARPDWESHQLARAGDAIIIALALVHIFLVWLACRPFGYLPLLYYRLRLLLVFDSRTLPVDHSWDSEFLLLYRTLVDLFSYCKRSTYWVIF